MEKQWYAIQTYVDYEQRVKAALQQKVRGCGQEDAFGEIVVPTEKVIDLVRGKKQTVERRLFPGYLLVERCRRGDTEIVPPPTPRIRTAQ
jgi:transcriptional antiterminator NusG